MLVCNPSQITSKLSNLRMCINLLPKVVFCGVESVQLSVFLNFKLKSIRKKGNKDS